jgi:hypothetical protein
MLSLLGWLICVIESHGKIAVLIGGHIHAFLKRLDKMTMGREREGSGNLMTGCIRKLQHGFCHFYFLFQNIGM